MTTWAAILVAVTSLLLASCASTKRVTSDEGACSMATARVTALRHVPSTSVAFCDHAQSTELPAGYYVLALHGHCQEEVCGSTNMGWFAVKEATGEVFEWDTADMKLGRPVRGGS
jgi:hypothetical protein